jgi:hypothetical protein
MKRKLLLSFSVGLAFQLPLLADTKSVDCNKGQSLNRALEHLKPGDTLAFTGTCREAVVVGVPGITLAGGGAAVIQPPNVMSDALTVNAVAGVSLQNFTCKNGNFGIHVKGNGGATLTSIVAQTNAQSGILVEGTSSAYIANSTAQNNGMDGVDAENSSSLTFSGTFLAQTNGVFGINLGVSSSATITDGTITAQQNALGIQVSIDSSFFLGSPAATVQTVNNASVGLKVVSGAHLFSFGGTIVTSGNGLDGIDLASRAGLDMDAATQASAFNNGRDGVHVEELSFINLFNNPQFSGQQGFTTVETYGNAVNGFSLLNNSQLHMFDQAQIESHDNTASGIQVDNGSSMTLINSTIQNNPQKDVVLTFGSRGEFSKNTIGTLSCDATSLIRGDTGKTCPTP